MIRYLFHISDLHVMESNYVNLKQSFLILVNRIKAVGVDQSLCVIVGDVFESKSYLSTDDIFHWKAIVHLLQSEGIKTLILVGNHDYNINSNLVRDNISLLTFGSNIRVFNQTTILGGDVFGSPNLEFYMFSPIDKKIPVIKDNKSIKIALLHESINSAKYDNGQTITGCRFNAGDLMQFDYVLLGDIHKQQYLSEKIAYCGSFVQKNKGESIHKGYILWDLETGTSEFHTIPLREVYIKVQANDNKYVLPKITPEQKVRYTSLFYKNCSNECIENIKSEMIKEYAYINRIVNKSEIIDNKMEINNVEKSVNHEDIIKQILGDDTRLQSILAHHRKTLMSRNETNHTTYTLNYMCWGNIYCYGPDNWINFREFSNDLVILSGNNKDGKSSIIDIIIRILYNEAIRGPKDEIVNKYKNEGYIKISFNIGSDEYIVEQIYNKSAKTQFHRLYKNDQNISHDTITQTYTYLRGIIGDYKSFVNLTTALQNRKFLVDMDQKDFITLLTEITNIDTLKDVETDTKKEINTLKSFIKKTAMAISNTTTVTDDDIESLKRSKDELVQLQKTLQDKLKNMNHKLVELHKGYINTSIPDDLLEQIKTSVSKLKDYPDSLRKRYPLADVKIQMLTEELNHIEKDIWEYKKILEPIDDNELHRIMNTEYGNLDPDNRKRIENMIRDLKEVTHKPNGDKTYDRRQLGAIIDAWVDEPLMELERCEIKEPVPLENTFATTVVLEMGLPNYEQIRMDAEKLRKQIDKFKSNFGSLEFSSECDKCTQNKSVVHQIFDIKHESHRLASLQNILDKEQETTRNYNAAKLYHYNFNQNRIFERNRLAKEYNESVNRKRTEYENAIRDMKELDNYEQYTKLKSLETELDLYKNNDIKYEKQEYDKLVVLTSYLRDLVQYIELTELYKIQKTNGNRIEEIDRINKSIEETDLKLSETNGKLIDIMDEYRIKQSDFDKLNTLHKEHVEYTNRLEFMNLYFGIINCKTGIPSYILKNTCISVERACNDILSKIADFTIRIVFDKDVKIYTVENDICIPAQMGSGMQKFVLDLIFRITLTEISSISCPKTLFVDEGFGALDKENFINIANILQKLKSNFDSLIIISHINELNAYVDKSIKITKNGNLSNVQHGSLQHHQKEIRLLFEHNSNNKRAREFKDSVKMKSSKTTESIHTYCAENGGVKTILFDIDDDTILCRGCNKRYKNRNGFMEKHIEASSTQAKHNKYIMNLYNQTIS